MGEQPNTHLRVDRRLCGEPIELREGYAAVRLVAIEEMVADDSGLVHGGFVFGLADYAAMLAINHPNVVLGSAGVRFLKPVRVEETLIAEASVISREGARCTVAVDVRREGETVLGGEFICFVPDRHVLDRSDK